MLNAKLHEIFKNKLFSLIVAIGAVGFQLFLLTIISEANPRSMLANVFIIYLTVALLTHWIGKSTKLGALATVISTSMILLYNCTLGYLPNYGAALILAGSTFGTYWLMFRGVMENEGDFSEEESSWSLIVLSAAVAGIYSFTPFGLLEYYGFSIGATEIMLRYIGALFILITVGLFLREVKRKVLNLNLPNEALARFFRVMATVFVILCVTFGIFIGYQFLYQYGQNNLVGEPGWTDVAYDDVLELLVIAGVLALALALSIGLVAFNTAEAVTASLIAAATLLLLETLLGNYNLTIQQFLINAIIFCLSALIVLESKGETLWE